MSSATKVAVVTGANKGIGFAIVKGLCRRFNGVVYLTARNASKGEVAVQQLNELGLNPSFHQLDISDRSSVLRFKRHLIEAHGGIDILINNAGVQFFRPYTEPLIDVAEKTMRGNFGNLRDFCDDIFPIIKTGGRVINTSSGFGILTNIPGENIRRILGNRSLTRRQLHTQVDNFISSIRRGTYDQDGWGDDPYKVSKVAVSALTFVQQRYLDSIGRRINVNAINPGYVSTDMNMHKGVLTPDQGAEVAIYAALDAPGNIKGEFIWANKQVIDWTGPFPE